MRTQELLTRLRDYHIDLVFRQARESDPQIIHCIEEVLTQIEELLTSIPLMEKIL